MSEIWKPIMNYECFYEISSFGRIKSLPRISGKFRLNKEKILASKLNRKYPCVTICKNGKLKTFTIHRLVAKTFIPNPENKPEVNHKNGIKTDNRVDNLEWVTSSENKIHRIKVLKIFNKRGKEDKRSRIILQISKGFVIGKYYGTHETERKTGICQSAIWRCCNGIQKTAGGYSWKYGDIND